MAWGGKENVPVAIQNDCRCLVLLEHLFSMCPAFGWAKSRDSDEGVGWFLEGMAVTILREEKVTQTQTFGSGYPPLGWGFST